MFSSEFYQISKNTSFVEHLRTATSERCQYLRILLFPRNCFQILGQLFSRHLPMAVFLFNITVYNKFLSMKFFISCRIAWPSPKPRQIPGYGMFSPKSISMFCSQSSKISCFFNSHTSCNVQHVATMFAIF